MIAAIPPHGGVLRNLLLEPEAASRAREEAITYPSIALNDREVCDLELLLNGSFSPLEGFLGRKDYTSVLERLRLAEGTLWPIPVTLGATAAEAERLEQGGYAALRDPEGAMVGRIRVADVWECNAEVEAEAVFGTTRPEHPGVRYLLDSPHRFYVGGRVEGFRLPVHFDFQALRRCPAEVRSEFAERKWERVVAFQTRNPLHRAHIEMTAEAARRADAHLLVHPVVGMTNEGDINHYARVRCYQASEPHYAPGLMVLRLLNLAMRMAGPREAVWHAIIRQNYGCSHFIVGRDHAGAGSDRSGKPYHPPYAAQELLEQHREELKIRMLPFPELVYSQAKRRYVPAAEAEGDGDGFRISGAELRRRLREGGEIPEWFTFPNIIAELRRAFPARNRQGLTLFLTGLAGAGKSTVAKALQAWFLERGGRQVTLLDGDVVRRLLSSELGFSREHRDLNILRIAYVAGEVSRNGGIAICAAIAPYAATRRQARALVAEHGAFVEIHVATPLAVCEARDEKGMYARARAGLIEHFTGVSDPYEVPEHPDITIDASRLTPAEAAGEILQFLEREGFLA